jgi:hypothetical protein
LDSYFAVVTVVSQHRHVVKQITFDQNHVGISTRPQSSTTEVP